MAPPKDERESVLLCISKVIHAAKDIRKAPHGSLGLLVIYEQFRGAYEERALARPAFVVPKDDQNIVLPDISAMQILRIAVGPAENNPEAVLSALLHPADPILGKYPLLAGEHAPPTKAALEFTARRLHLYVSGEWRSPAGAWAYATHALAYCYDSGELCNVEWIYAACSIWLPDWFDDQGKEWNLFMKQFFHALSDQETEREDYDYWLKYTRSVALFMIAYVMDNESRAAISGPQIRYLQTLLYNFVTAAHMRDIDSLLAMGPQITDRLFDTSTATATNLYGRGESHVFRLHAGNLEQIHAALGSQHAELAGFVHSTGGGSLSDYIEHLHTTRHQTRVAGDIASSLKAKYARRGTKTLPDISFPEFEDLWQSFVSNLHGIEEARGDGDHSLTADQIKKRKKSKVSGAAAANGNNADDPMPQDRFLAAPSLAEQLAMKKTELNRVEPTDSADKPPPPPSSSGFDMMSILKGSPIFKSFGQQEGDNNGDASDSDEEDDWSGDEQDTVTFTKDTTDNQQTNTVSISSKKEKPTPPPRPVAPAPVTAPPAPVAPLVIPEVIPPFPPPTAAPPLPPRVAEEEVPPPPPPVEISTKEKSTLNRLVSGIFRDSSDPEPVVAPPATVPAPPPGVATVPAAQMEEVTGRSWDRAWKSGTDILNFITTQEEFDVFTYYLKWAASMRYSIKTLRSLGSKARRPYSRKTGMLQDFTNYYTQNKKKGETKAQFIERNTPLFTTDMSVADTYALMSRLSASMIAIFRAGLRHTNQDWDAAWKRVFPGATLKQRREMYDFYFFMGEVAQAIVPAYKRTHGFGYASPYVFAVPKDTERGYEDPTKRARFTWKLADGIVTGASTDHFSNKKYTERKGGMTKKKKGGAATIPKRKLPTATATATATATKKRTTTTTVRTKRGLAKRITPGLPHVRGFFGQASDPIHAQMKRQYALQVCNAPTPSTAIHERMLAEHLPNVIGDARYQVLLVRDEQMQQLEASLLKDPVDCRRFLQQQLIDRHRCLHDHESGGGNVILCNAEGHQLEAEHTRRFINADNMQHLIPGAHPVVMHLPILF